MKDQILELFEVDYKRIKEKAHWSMDMAVQYDTYFHSIFTAEVRDEYIPINYPVLLNDQTYYGIILNIKEMLRDWYREDVILALGKSETLVKQIEIELQE